MVLSGKKIGSRAEDLDVSVKLGKPHKRKSRKEKRFKGTWQNTLAKPNTIHI